METQITLATTTSTQDSGLLDELLPAFEKKYKTQVKVLAVGSGQAFEIGKKGDADVLLVHARADEDKFVQEGWGVNRRDVMHNQFLLVGPAADPAQVKSSSDIFRALKAIAGKKAAFISRGDNSGTHKKELKLWQDAGITPAGTWYLEAGQGMGDTLMMASEKEAYTLTDEATYLTMKEKLKLVIVREGDKALLNKYGVMAVNPKKYPKIHINGAMAFVSFVTSEEGQKLIYDFGRAKYGKPLFIPDAINPQKLE
ncbi:MAG: substrate-binding domain-containing protein [Methylocystaceae bacterium]